MLLIGCSDAPSSEVASRALMESLGERVTHAHCVSPWDVTGAYCTLKTERGQIYTTHCIRGMCNVERGPGQ